MLGDGNGRTLTLKKGGEMSNRKFPAFSAEASLYRTNNHYRLTAAGTLPSSGALPQMMRNEVDEQAFWNWFNNDPPSWVSSAEGAGRWGGSGRSSRSERCLARCQERY